MMPYDSGFQNPDGTYTFTGGGGQSLTTAPTPFAAEYLQTLQSRNPASAPLAMGDPVMSGGGAGASGGGFRTKNYQMVPQPVADVGPSYSHADQGAQGAGAGVSLPPPVVVAPPEAVPAAPGRVDPSKVVLAQPAAGGAAPSGGGAPGYADAAADLYARAAMAPGGASSRVVKGGTFQTGQDTKTKVEGGKSDERIGAMSAQVLTQGLADQNLQQAQGEHEQYVDGHMGFARFEQQGLDALHQERKQQALRGLQDERERVEKEVGETRIDPQEFWADKSDGQKIAFVLAAAVTGFFNGRAGIQGNQVLTAVNKRIDDNIGSQVRNLETKKGRVGELGRIYQQAKEQWGDETVARNMAKIAALTEAEKTVRRQAVETGSKIALAQADKVAADLAAQREKLWFDNAGKVTEEMDKKFRVTQDSVQGGGDLTLKQRADILAKGGEQQAKAQEYARGPDPAKGPQMAVFGGEQHEMRGISPQEGEHIRTKLAVVDVLKRDLAEVRKLREASLSEKAFPSSYQKDVVGRISENLSTLKGMGVVRESDVARTMDALTSIRSGSESLASTEGFLHTTGQSVLKQAGSRPIGPAK